MNDSGYAKRNKNVAACLRVIPLNRVLLWQLNNHRHIGSITELLRCHIDLSNAKLCVYKKKKSSKSVYSIF